MSRAILLFALVLALFGEHATAPDAEGRAPVKLNAGAGSYCHASRPGCIQEACTANAPRIQSAAWFSAVRSSAPRSGRTSREHFGSEQIGRTCLSLASSTRPCARTSDSPRCLFAALNTTDVDSKTPGPPTKASPGAQKARERTMMNTEEGFAQARIHDEEQLDRIKRELVARRIPRPEGYRRFGLYRGERLEVMSAYPSLDAAAVDAKAREIAYLRLVRDQGIDGAARSVALFAGVALDFRVERKRRAEEAARERPPVITRALRRFSERTRRARAHVRRAKSTPNGQSDPAPSSDPDPASPAPSPRALEGGSAR